MATGAPGQRVTADVKCYYCGHISGQIVALRGQALRISDFVPRRGYSGPELKPGMRVRCERCKGPVFLEEVTGSEPLRARKRPAAAQMPRKAA
ncbi:MAG TPA: hypothetical protein VFY10_11425 [Dehalococcoidia bacterium]|nr:hypothetical protein [Dehalococcoidia bacterium]